MVYNYHEIVAIIVINLINVIKKNARLVLYIFFSKKSLLFLIVYITTDIKRDGNDNTISALVVSFKAIPRNCAAASKECWIATDGGRNLRKRYTLSRKSRSARNQLSGQPAALSPSVPGRERYRI